MLLPKDRLHCVRNKGETMALSLQEVLHYDDSGKEEEEVEEGGDGDWGSDDDDDDDVEGEDSDVNRTINLTDGSALSRWSRCRPRRSAIGGGDHGRRQRRSTAWQGGGIAGYRLALRFKTWRGARSG